MDEYILAMDAKCEIYCLSNHSFADMLSKKLADFIQASAGQYSSNFLSYIYSMVFINNQLN